MKLLVATEFPPNAPGGGPAVIRQMLSGWPVQELFWWSCLPDRERRFEQSVQGASCASIPGKLMPHRRWTRAKSALLEAVWAPFAARHLQRTIARLQPDAVWAIPHNWSILPLASVLPQAGIGFHVTMQDYVDVHGQPEKFGPRRCRRMARLADDLYAHATTRDATSHPMVDDLRARTGARAAQMLHAGLEAVDFQYLAEKRPVQAGKIRIAYAGTILAKREFAFFVEALKRLRLKLSVPIGIDLFSAHSYSQETWFDDEWMQEHGNLPEGELLGKLRDCTWGFAPMSLSDDDRRYNRFSFPTKFISYLAAGLPTIVLGHEESSIMKMAAMYKVGISSATTSLDELIALLADGLPAPNSCYAAEIVRCARTEFDAECMRRVLYACLESCREQARLQRAASTR